MSLPVVLYSADKYVFQWRLITLMPESEGRKGKRYDNNDYMFRDNCIVLPDFYSRCLRITLSKSYVSRNFSLSLSLQPSVMPSVSSRIIMKGVKTWHQLVLS